MGVARGEYRDHVSMLATFFPANRTLPLSSLSQSGKLQSILLFPRKAANSILSFPERGR